MNWPTLLKQREREEKFVLRYNERIAVQKYLWLNANIKTLALIF